MLNVKIEETFNLEIWVKWVSRYIILLKGKPSCFMPTKCIGLSHISGIVD